MARVKSRLTGEAADFDAPETKEEIIKAIKDSEVNRDVEIDYELTEEIENFPDFFKKCPGVIPNTLCGMCGPENDVCVRLRIS